MIKNLLIERYIKPIMLATLMSMTMAYEANSREIYFKWDMPVYKVYNDKENKRYKEKSKSRLLAESEVGIGYNYSKNIDIELMMSQKDYVFHSKVIGKGEHKCRFTKNYDIPFKTYAHAKPAYNSKYKKWEKNGMCDASKIYRVEDICKPEEGNTKTEVISNYDDGIVNMKLYSIMPSIKFKLENESRLTPFVMMGAGMTYAKIKGEMERDEGGNQKEASKEINNKIGFSYNLGIGAKVRVLPKLDVELGVRYFDYGKYKIAKEESKRIRGYSATAGVVIKLHNTKETK